MTLKIKAALPLLLSISGFCFLLYLVYPGFMSNDSFNQLGQALNQSYTNWHPPVMAWVWTQWLRILPGPLGMVCMQGFAFWGSLFLGARFFFPQQWKRQSVFIFVLGFFPSLFFFPGIVWKDSSLGCFYLFGFMSSLTFYRARTQDRNQRTRVTTFFWGLIALLSLFYAFGLRHNSLFSSAPLLALWMWAFVAPKNQCTSHQILKIFLGTAALLFLCFIFHKKIQSVLTEDVDKTALYPTLLEDLTALSISANTSFLPAYLQQEAGDIEKIEKDNQVRPMAYSFPEEPSQRKEVKEAWFRAARAVPFLFLKHRIFLWLKMLGISGTQNAIFIGQDQTHPQVTPWKKTHFREAITFLYSKTSHTIFFLPGLYFLMGVFLLLYFYNNYLKNPAFFFPLICLTCSSLLYSIGYLLLSSASDFRFHWWTVLGVLFAFFSEGLQKKAAIEKLSLRFLRVRFLHHNDHIVR